MIEHMRKTVFVLEDKLVQREALRDFLRREGFDVVAAGTVDEARSKAESAAYRFDVAVLDMRLEDPEHPNVTGADIGLEMLERSPDWPPEFLIASAYPEAAYYRAAHLLGTVAYLHKAKVALSEIVSHVQALALMRALSLKRPDLVQHFRELVAQRVTPLESIEGFCRDLLVPEMALTFKDIPFLVVASQIDRGKRSRLRSIYVAPSSEGEWAAVLGRSDELQQAFDFVQSMAQGSSDQFEAFVFEKSKFSTWDYLGVRRNGGGAGELDGRFFELLDGACFVPLRLNNELAVSIAVLPSKSKRAPDGREFRPALTAEVIRRYLAPTIVRSLFKILVDLNQIETEKRSILAAASQFCLYVAQEQGYLIDQAVLGREMDPNRANVRKLMQSQAGLLEAGDIIAALSEISTAEEGAGKVREALDLGKLSEEVLREYAESTGLDLSNVHVSEGRCEVLAFRDELALLVAKMLELFLQREAVASIYIGCEEEDGYASIEFRDESPVIPPLLRERLTKPFSHPLSFPPELRNMTIKGSMMPFYLAKVVAEIRNNGVLLDRTDDQKSNGNRFVFRFPKAPSAR